MRSDRRPLQTPRPPVLVGLLTRPRLPVLVRLPTRPTLPRPPVLVGLAIVAVFGLAVASCGGPEDDATSTTTTTTASSTTAPTTSEAASSTTAAPTTTASSTASAPSSTTTAATSTTSLVLPGPTVPAADLPGEVVEFGPPAGTILSVFGVRHDDVLNVRDLPGLDGEIVATLDPTESGFLATGRHQQLPTTFWMEVVVDGEVIGWINRTFAAVEGVTDDGTARFLDRIADPTASSLEALGLLVAESVVEVPEAVQRIEMSVAPTEGDLGEVTYDVVGIADDASAGVRLHVFAVDESGDGTWTLRTVEVTDMCSRGGTPGGLCP